MKPKNFPARKVIRQLKAQAEDLNNEHSQGLIEGAMSIRTKKIRVKKTVSGRSLIIGIKK